MVRQPIVVIGAVEVDRALGRAQRAMKLPIAVQRLEPRRLVPIARLASAADGYTIIVAWGFSVPTWMSCIVPFWFFGAKSRRGGGQGEQTDRINRALNSDDISSSHWRRPSHASTLESPHS